MGILAAATMSGQRIRTTKMDVPVPIHEWLFALKTQLSAARGYTVTYPEVWHHVKEQYEATASLGAGVTGIRRAGR